MTTLVEREKEIFPDRVRWTRQECSRLAEAGFLVGRYELIDGEIIRKMGQGWMHSEVIMRLMRALVILFESSLRIQLPMTVPGDTSEPEPDIAVTEQPLEAYRGRQPDAQEMLLVVEVADTTRNFDLNIKSRLYAQAGLRDYWVVDIAERSIVVHREPVANEYLSVTTHTESETLSLLLRPDVSLSITTVLPAADAETR